MSLGRWWRDLERTPGYLDDHPGVTLGVCLAGVLVLLIVVAVVVALDVPSAR